jgi:UDP-glucose 4-epimerase
MASKGPIRVTGGAGFIGSHTCVELLNGGYDVMVVDNLANRNRESLKRVEQSTGKRVAFYEADSRDAIALQRIVDTHSVTGAIHFAALRAVGESVAKPIEYYDNNLGSLLTLLGVMRAQCEAQFVFGSSATVYGAPKNSPIDESFPLSATNPYGQSKLIARSKRHPASRVPRKSRRPVRATRRPASRIRPRRKGFLADARSTESSV